MPEIEIKYDINEKSILLDNIDILDIPKNIVYLKYNKGVIVDFDCNLFSNLVYLDLSKNRLKSFKFSKSIENVSLNYNNLEEISIPDDNKLTELYISYNNLKIFKVPENLKILGINFNNLEKIIIPSNAKLIKLYANINKIRNISINETLEIIYLDFNFIQNLIIPQNANLKILHICYNELNNLELNKNLKTLFIGNMVKSRGFDELDESDIYYIYQNNYNKLNNLVCNEDLEYLRLFNMYGLKLENILFNSKIKILSLTNMFSKYNNYKFPDSLKELEFLYDYECNYKDNKNYIIPKNLDIIKSNIIKL